MPLQDDFWSTDCTAPQTLAAEIREEVEAGKITASFSDGSKLYTHAGLRSAVRIALQDQDKVAAKTAVASSTRAGLKELSDRLDSIFSSSVEAGDLKSHPIFHVDRERGGRHDIGGIFWGDYSLISASEHAYDVPQIFGHTPSYKSSVNHCRGLKLIDIDTGMCQVYGGHRVYLEIGPGNKITTGVALRYHDHGLWSARAGYEWTGTHDPGYLVVPQSNNRITSNFTFTPAKWLVFSNDANFIVQNAFQSAALPNTSGDFQRRNRFYFETASATVQALPDWNLGLGYSYQQNNLTTYMAFQNDNAVGYVLDQPAVPYKQISQTYWGESTYTFGKRLGVNVRLTYNSARSGFRPDVNPNAAALLGNQSLITSGTFDPVMFSAALNNMSFSSTQISQVIVPEWIGQSKAFYLFPHKVEGGLIFYYGSYRDYWNPNLNGVLRTFNVYVGRSW